MLLHATETGVTSGDVAAWAPCVTLFFSYLIAREWHKHSILHYMIFGYIVNGIEVKVKSASYERGGPSIPGRRCNSGFCNMKRLGILLLPSGWDASPSQG